MLKRTLQCLGLASLLLLENYIDLLAGAPTTRLHVPFPLAAICLAHILDILIITLILLAILLPLRRTRIWPIALLLLYIAIPLYFLAREHALLPFALPDLLVALLYILYPITLLFLFLRQRPWYRRFSQLAGTLAIAAGIFGLGGIFQMLLLTHWKPGPQQHTAAWVSPPQPPRQHPLLVWILFDELSYDQLFEHRAKDLALPNFDALRAQSTLFTDVQPIGNRTAKIVPSLLAGEASSGHIVSGLRFSMSNQLSLHFSDQRGWHPVNPAQSIFADAQRAGWRTAAVGWYNPYCTVYAGAIDDCFWTNHDRLEGPMAQNETILANTRSALAELELRALSPSKAEHEVCNYDVQKRLQTHLDLAQHSLQLLKTDQADFVFLHLSIPHSPNIWSRIDGDYTHSCDSSYLDNLALADRQLGQMLAILEASPRWQQTSIIVQGDHSWRVNLWNGLPAWTDEDDQASRGVFDPRPAMLVHQAGETTPETNPSAWPLLNIHTLVENILHKSE